MAIFIYFLLIMANATLQQNSIRINTHGTPLGTVIYSILPPEIFTNLNEGWVLLQGQEIDKSWALSQYYNVDTLPSALGRFIRSSNNNGIGEDLNKLSEIGRYQKFATAMPDSTFEFTGCSPEDHIHASGFKAYVEFNSSFNLNYNTQKTIKKDGFFPLLFFEKYHDNMAKFSTKVPSVEEKCSISGGDYETRPSNISLYCYIKVN